MSTVSAVTDTTAPRDDAKVDGQLYLPALDGLRVIAFLMVFVHHMPASNIPGLATLHRTGWIGVEMFFTISAFLFFHLLGAESARNGSINIAHFYARRLLRILPLLWVYVIASLVIFGPRDAVALARMAGTMLGFDNLAIWIGGYNSSIYAAAHLWTLSFELQIYLLIPFAFLVYRKLGRARFAAALIAVAVYCTFTRLAAASLGAPHPTIWVTPFLRPESILLGIAISMAAPPWKPEVSGGMALVFGALLAFIPSPDTYLGSVLMYPVAALFSACTLDVVIRHALVKKVLSLAPLRYLGTISYGLYVFHVVSITLADKLLRFSGFADGTGSTTAMYLAQFVLALGITVALAAFSFACIERPFLSLKSRIAAVNGR